MGVAFVHDPRLVRGLDYYTRTAFEFVSGALSQAQSTVCGGGRYDGLAEVLGARRRPAWGSPSVSTARSSRSTPRAESVRACDRSRASSCRSGPRRRRSGRVVEALRTAGTRGAAYEERPLKAQLKMADRSGAAYAVILGEREVASGAATLRRLADGEQDEVPIDDVVNWLSRTDWAAER